MRDANFRTLTIAAGVMMATVLCAAPMASAASAELSVTLFGQPCTLSGPFEKNTLTAIHAISPEQVYPEDPISTDPAPFRKALEKLKKAGKTPNGLDRYKDRLTRRLEAQLAFLNGWESAKKVGKAEALLSPTEPFRSGKRGKDFEAQVRKLEAAKKFDSSSQGQLYQAYLEMIEADPEEEFHRAIKVMNVRYTCDFADEGEEDETEE